MVWIDTHDLTSLPVKSAFVFGLPDSSAPSKMNFTFAGAGDPPYIWNSIYFYLTASGNGLIYTLN
jgi:hypothetical protein